jgi:uncharacterized membrane protein YczE
VGWLLGGTVGIGTLVYAVAIGPLTHFSIPALAIKSRSASSSICVTLSDNAA